MIFYTLELFKQRPKILKIYQSQFKYVLVDEFQDTNWAQYELVKLLSAPQNNLSVVGDDDQSIYKFRGASLSNILQFSSDFPEAKKVILTENYRSGQKILDQAYAFISLNNPNRLEVQLEEGLSKRLVSKKEEVGDVEHIHCSTIDDEARTVVDRIRILQTQDVPLAEMAILVRANDSAEPFIQALEQQQVAYQFLALRGLYAKEVILDALAFLRILDHPHHSQSWYRILSHLTLGISSSELVKITHESFRLGRSLYEVIAHSSAVKEIGAETNETLSHLLAVTNSLRDAAKRKPVNELFVDVMKESGILGFQHIGAPAAGLCRRGAPEPALGTRAVSRRGRHHRQFKCPACWRPVRKSSN